MELSQSFSKDIHLNANVFKTGSLTAKNCQPPWCFLHMQGSAASDLSVLHAAFRATAANQRPQLGDSSCFSSSTVSMDSALREPTPVGRAGPQSRNHSKSWLLHDRIFGKETCTERERHVERISLLLGANAGRHAHLQASNRPFGASSGVVDGEGSLKAREQEGLF